MSQKIRPETRATVGLAAAWALLVALCASAAEVKTLAIMLPEEPTDFGWNQQAFQAARTVAAKYHLQFMPATGLGYGDVRAELRELADDGASLIIAHASGYNTAAPEVGAERHVPVAIVDRPKDAKPGAVADYTLSGREGAYLAGILAAKTTRTHVVAIVVAAESPPWNSQSAAFAQGVRATDPGVKVLYAVIGPAAYADVAGGRRVTESAIGARADVIFGQGDRASFGMLQAVDTQVSAGGGKVWFIDQLGDKSSLDQGHLLSSVIWNLVPVYSAMIEDLKDGKFGTHPYSIQLADDSVRLLHSKYIPDDVWSGLETVRNQIIHGQVKVEPVWDAATVRAMMTSVAAPAR
jgi:simple sugar transport system substrate-binding protein